MGRSLFKQNSQEEKENDEKTTLKLTEIKRPYVREIKTAKAETEEKREV